MGADSDAETWEELAAALAPARAVPSPDEIVTLRQLVADRGSGWTTALPEGSRRTRRSSQLVLSAAAVLVVVLAVAASTWHGLPRPVRVVASAAGLPVESPQLGDARHSLRALKEALSRSDRSAVISDAADLRRRMASLDLDDRRQLSAEAAAALAAADTIVQAPTRAGSAATPESPAPNRANGGPATGSSPTPPTSRVPTSATPEPSTAVDSPTQPPSEAPATTTITSGGDGGGHDGGSDGGSGSSPGGSGSSTMGSSDGGGTGS